MKNSTRLIAILAQMSEPERDRFIKQMAVLEAHAEGAAKALQSLRLQLSEPQVDEEPSSEDDRPLCSSCANPCEKRSADIERCGEYHELVDVCVGCYYWEADLLGTNGRCTSLDPCVGGGGFLAPRKGATEV